MKSKTKKKIFKVFVVMFVLFLIHHIFWSFKVAGTVKKMRNDGSPTTCAELNVEYLRIPYNVDASETYSKAFLLYNIEEKEGIPIFSKKKVENPDMNVVKSFLDGNQEALDLLHKGAGISKCKYPVDFSKGYGMLLSHLSNVKKGVQLLSLEALYYSKMGDSDKSYESIIAGLRLSNSVSNEPTLISYLVKIATRALTFSRLEQAMKEVSFTDAQYQNIIAVMDDGVNDQLKKSFMAEKCLFDVIVNGSGNEINGIDTGFTAIFHSSLKSIAINKMNYVAMIDLYDKYIEFIELPPVERNPQDLEDIETETVNKSFIYIYVKMLMPACGKVAEVDKRHVAHTDLVKAAISIERYKLANGDLPDSLDSSFIDVFNGLPLRYEKTDEGYLIYSVGKDKVDNSGTIFDSEGKKYKEGTDIVFSGLK